MTGHEIQANAAFICTLCRFVMVKLSPESSQRARLGMPSATGACMGDTSERVCLRGVQCRPVITRCSHLFCGDCFHQYARKQAGLLSCRALQAGAQSQFPGRAPQESEDADGARPVLSCIPVSLALALSLSVLSASLSLSRSLALAVSSNLFASGSADQMSVP